jgi:hypothetical protein
MATDARWLLMNLITLDILSALAAAIAVVLAFRRDPARSILASGLSTMLSTAARLQRLRQGDSRA